MRIIPAIVLGAVTVLSGCASMPSSTATGAVASSASDGDVDMRRVASIEHVAKGRGVDIYWVNFPQRRASAAGALTAPPASAPPTGT